MIICALKSHLAKNLISKINTGGVFWCSPAKPKLLQLCSLVVVHHNYGSKIYLSTRTSRRRSCLPVGFDFRKVGCEIHVHGLYDWHSCLKFPTEVQYREEHKRQVIRDESSSVPAILQEDFPSTELWVALATSEPSSLPDKL